MPRLAAIDIGSNAMRCTIIQAGGGARGRLDYLRAAVRLGTAVFRTGRLGRDELERALEALIQFRRRMDDLDVDRYRAVATSAVREAANGGDLVERARREAGLDLEVIDGGEEARLVWVAARDRLDVPGRWLLVDLGGGSLEVSVVAGGGLERSATYPLGTVRLLERLRSAGGGSDGAADGTTGVAVEEALTELEVERVLPSSSELEGLMATGGNIEALAELAGARRDGAGVARVSLEALSRAMADVEALPYERRMSELGLRADRADVIVPAGRIYRRVAELAGVAEIVVPHVGVTDGILLELTGG